MKVGEHLNVRESISVSVYGEQWVSETYIHKGETKRLYIYIAMIRSVLLDKESWTEHIMLDPETGLDPPGYKIRAVHGKMNMIKKKEIVSRHVNINRC